jgi:hypothetical protein
MVWVIRVLSESHTGKCMNPKKIRPGVTTYGYGTCSECDDHWVSYGPVNG